MFDRQKRKRDGKSSTLNEEIHVEIESPQFTGAFSSSKLSGGSGTLMFFLPGLALVALALVTVFAPRLLLWAMGAILFLFGIGMCVLAWKFIRLKRRLEEAAKQFQGRVFVEGVDFPGGSNFSNPDEEDDDDFIVYH